MSALTRYSVMAPGVSRAVEVYAPDRAAALRTGADELGLRSMPAGSTAIPVINEHAPRLAA